MVGPLLLLKFLHCRRLKRMNANAGEESAVEGTSYDEGTSQNVGSSHDETPEVVNVKKEDVDHNICRVCLKEGSIPIYRNNSLEDISEALNTFGGIEVKIDDPYPKFLCQVCNGLLNNAMLLRKTAQQSDELLRLPIEHFDNDEILECLEDDKSSVYEEPKSKKLKSYHCKKCQISFDTFKEYNDHKLSNEHENMRLVCPVCHKSYSAMYFRKHLTIHKQETPYMCDICGKKFIMQSPFNRHRLTHFYKLPFKCSLCPYKGRFRESLKMHMRSHTGEKPYQCTQCPSRFINKSNLNKHMLTHKSDHDFKCEFCGRGFYSKKEVDVHYQVDHTGIKNHICNVCGKAFGYRKQMMKHQLKVHKRAKLRSGRMPLYLKIETLKQQGEDITLDT